MTGEKIDNEFILGYSEEDLLRGSKFAAPGEHVSECGTPDWDTPGKSIKFPFTIVEEGDDNGKEGKISCGVKKEAAFKLKEMLEALGVAHQLTGDGRVKFSALECAGKKFKSVWVEQEDTRPVSEGGTGSKYSKAVGALPLAASTEELV